MNRNFSRTVLAVALGFGLFLLSAQRLAADYSVPVTWSPMTMLNVSYGSATGQLSVADQGSVIAYLAINTDSTGKINTSATTWASFDPSQPWSVLNGTAFSRRLGWWTSDSSLSTEITSAYGANASIWIETESLATGLKTYKAVGKYGVGGSTTVVTDATAYTEILSSVGAKWDWDYQMDHNTYALDEAYFVPGQTYSATYKVYVGDSSGNEIFNTDGSSTATYETWTWTAASVPEPASLGILAVAAGSLLARRLLKRRSTRNGILRPTV